MRTRGLYGVLVLVLIGLGVAAYVRYDRPGARAEPAPRAVPVRRVPSRPVHVRARTDSALVIASGALLDRMGIANGWIRMYEDPVAGGAEPLMGLDGTGELPVSAHFTLADFAPRDGAPYVRISPRLVVALEKLRAYVVSDLRINSAYRYPALNFSLAVGGADESQHMAGRAIDLASGVWTPLELAQAALDTLGCAIGLGLGPTFIHLDVRGSLSTWTYRGAALSERAFDNLARETCGLPLLPEGIPDTLNVAEPAFTFEPYRAATNSFARMQKRQGKRGAVLLDLRADSTRAQEFPFRLGWIEAGSPEATRLGVDVLIPQSRSDQYYVFAIIQPDGTVVAAVAPLELIGEP